MSPTTIDIDDELLAAAARELGTSSKVDTVNAALAVWGSPDLADTELRAQARR